MAWAPVQFPASRTLSLPTGSSAGWPCVRTVPAAEPPPPVKGRAAVPRLRRSPGWPARATRAPPARARAVPQVHRPGDQRIYPWRGPVPCILSLIVVSVMALAMFAAATPARYGQTAPIHVPVVPAWRTGQPKPAPRRCGRASMHPRHSYLQHPASPLRVSLSTRTSEMRAERCQVKMQLQHPAAMCLP